MSQVINTNIYSLTAQKNLAQNNSALQQAITRLSSGLRINSAADDAAGLAIATRIDAQIRGQTVAERNANDATSMMQVADGGAASITSDLQRMRELAVQAANGSLSSGDKTNLSTEFQALQNEISRVAQGTKFNNIALLSSGNAFTFQVGAGTATSDQLTISTTDLQASSLGVDSASINILDSTNGNTNSLAAIASIDSVLNTINTTRAVFGAGLNRVSNAVSNLQTSVTNQSAAKSRIMDADFAAETANLTRAQILQQAGTAMLAQANTIPNQVLSLLR